MEEEKINKIKELIEEIRPYLNMDGGDLEFVKYEDKYLYIRMTGACQACMFQDNTINDCLLSFFQAELPELEGIINVNI